MPADDGKLRLTQLPRVQGALVALDPQNGAIRSLVGGFSFYHNKFNRAVQAYRQPGSNIKPFLYTAALENGFTPASIINDAPIVFHDVSLEGNWRPQNDNGEFNGPMRLREALYRSRNLVSIRIMRLWGSNGHASICSDSVSSRTNCRPTCHSRLACQPRGQLAAAE